MTADESTAAVADATTSMSPPSNQFELELEFVQSLASPAYLHYLATTGTLYQQSFLDYLRYLRYWKQPQYAKYLLYPHCLYFLDLLVPASSDPDYVDGDGDGDNNKNDGTEENNKNNGDEGKKSVADSGEAFRREMAQVPFRNFVHEQQFYSWQFRSARLYGRGEGTKEGELGAPGVEEEADAMGGNS